LQNYPLLNLNVFELINGNYSYSAYLFYENNLTIPEKVTNFCPCPKVLNVCSCSEESVIMPQLQLDSLPIGSAQANITISNDLYTSNKIILYVFVNKVPLTWDEFENLKQAEDLFEYNYLLHPKFKNEND
jgi:hypothetical protein